ncbi:MAM domain-containing glycosylphosphatidylinositol anchor protein 2-like, partial [Anneissia japonica]|uniref:MAM domain-containing glycosylphosphatidylinositol anchor protein 2-like n=1 Tax=Anneissia japonica TaxID=1529436 RepID=UPI00142594CA
QPPYYMVLKDVVGSQDLTEGETARLISPCYPLSTTLDMTFYYHMYGEDMGTLNVYVGSCDVTSFSDPVFTRSGNQGDEWIEGTINYDVSGIDGDIKIVFEAIRGASAASVIAIDDVSIV